MKNFLKCKVLKIPNRGDSCGYLTGRAPPKQIKTLALSDLPCDLMIIILIY